MANTFTTTYNCYNGTNSKSELQIEGILQIDTAAGATVGSLPASLFGLTVIKDAVPLILSNNSASYIGVPSFDGTSLLIKLFSSNGFVNLPNGDYNLTVRGR